MTIQNVAFEHGLSHIKRRNSVQSIICADMADLILVPGDTLDNDDEQSKLFQRLIWLVDTIYSAGKITRDEIDRRWANSQYKDDDHPEEADPRVYALDCEDYGE